MFGSPSDYSYLIGAQGLTNVPYPMITISAVSLYTSLFGLLSQFAVYPSDVDFPSTRRITEIANLYQWLYIGMYEEGIIVIEVVHRSIPLAWFYRLQPLPPVGGTADPGTQKTFVADLSYTDFELQSRHVTQQFDVTFRSCVDG